MHHKSKALHVVHGSVYESIVVHETSHKDCRDTFHASHAHDDSHDTGIKCSTGSTYSTRVSV